ncbi:MAG: restriction endonuclease subunit S [Alphaproteobacteria bacterium]|nr:restriction endonuclease subunit S [Alphaproteobacteria bacterium]
MIKLSDFASVTAGQGAPQDDSAFVQTGGKPFIRAGSLDMLCSGNSENDCEHISDEAAQKHRLKIYPENSILFAKSGMSAKMGRVYRLRNPAYVVSHLAIITPQEKVAEPSYLEHWFRANPPSNLIKDEAYPSIRTSEIEQISVPLPTLDEQKRIAGILDKADAIRRKRAESLKLLDELLRATFLDMFGDPITNPKGWPTKGLLELFDITTGKLDSNAAVPGGEYPFFTCARESFWIDNYAFDSEVLLLAGNNASADYSVKHYKGKFNAYQRTYVMSLKDQRNHYRLFKIALESRLGELKRRSKGTNTKYLTMGILKEIMLPVPDYNLQNQFDEIAQKVEVECQKLNSYASESDTLFHSLVARAFKGEL